jgi:hypothetical protein
VAVPLFRALAQAFPGTEPLLQAVGAWSRLKCSVSQWYLDISRARAALPSDVP